MKRLRVRGMALFPFIVLRDPGFRHDAVIMNHELIHHRQQMELLLLPFYLAYVLNYLLNRLRYPTHDAAYRNIAFEREAFDQEKDLHYLKKRKWFAFVKYFDESS